MTIDGDILPLLALCEQQLGLGPDDYRAPGRLEPRAGALLRGHAEDQALLILLAGCLGQAERHRDALRLMEAALGVTTTDYADGGRLADRLARATGHLDPTVRTTLVVAYLSCLSVLGHQHRAATLLAADLGLSPAGPGTASADDLRRTLLPRLAGLDPDAVAQYLFLLPLTLSDLGHRPDAIVVLEEHLGLGPGDYASPERLRARLGPWFAGLSALLPGQLAVTGIALALGDAGRTRDGSALLDWAFGVPTDELDGPRARADAWRRAIEDVPADLARTVWRIRADLEERDDDPDGEEGTAGSPDAALARLLEDCGLTPGDLDDEERFGPVLHRSLAGTQLNTRAAYLFSLVDELDRRGRERAADRVLDWFLRGYRPFWSPPPEGDPLGVTHLVPMLERRLRGIGAADPGQAWSTGEQVVRYLRGSLLFRNTALEDRREFVRYLDGVRRQLRVLGREAVRAVTDSGPGDPPDLVGERRRRVVRSQTWDAELGQRLLFERFLLTTVEPIAPAEPPADRWPLPGPEPDHLPDPSGTQVLSSLRRVGRPQASSVRNGAREPVTEGTDTDGAWLGGIEAGLRAGLTPARVASTLEPGGLLLQASFAPDGSLFWAASRPGGDDGLRVVRTGYTRPGARTRLRWAVLQHDLGLLMLADDDALSGPVPDEDLVLTSGGMLAENLAQVLGTAGAGLDGPADQQAWERLSAGLRELDRDGWESAGRERVGARLLAMIRESGGPGDEARAQLTRLAAVAAAHRRDEPGRDPGTTLRDIDAATRDYLAEVGRIWPLDALADELDAGDDVVLHLEDVLRAVPVAHHPLTGGDPLYARVRSVRVSLSVLVDLVQAGLPDRGPGGRILALSSFDDEADQVFAGRLHHDQRRLARDLSARFPTAPVVCLNAARQPPGTAGALRAALEDGSGFETVTVCGHGSAHEAGVELAGGLWRGDGCDWRSVDLLLLLSCSVGRLRQDGDQDVEGLCVRLALHRARSVLACRWPVITPQAVAFADHVVAGYLRLRRDGADPASLRARAVNQARRHFLAGDGRAAGLNTVAAFELNGLG